MRDIHIAATAIRTALGGDVRSTYEAIVRGDTGLAKTAPDGRVSSRPVIAGLIPDSEYTSLEEQFGTGYSRAELLAAEAAVKVLEKVRGRIDRTGLVLATAKGNISMLEGCCGNGHFVINLVKVQPPYQEEKPKE